MTKAQVAVVTDSTCNIPQDLLELHKIHVIPQVVNWDGASLLDGIDIQPAEFYQRLSTSDTMPTTSQPSAGEFLEFFTGVAENAETIVAILVSDELSGTLDSARTAAGMLEGTPIEIVDSRSASMGLGLIVLAAARAAERGLSHQAVAEVARSIVPKMKVMFVVDTLEFLHKGGRIGGAQRLIGSMLSMKPLLHLVDGRIEPLARIRTKKKAIKHLLEIVFADTESATKVHAAILSAVAPYERDEIRAAVIERVNPVEMPFAELSPVIGTHVGPGTVGIAYYSD